jgi:hypothetical protein
MGMDSKAGSWLLLAVLAVSAATAVHGSLMAIDLGSEFLKVCLVKPGRTPISIVVNEMSKRKSPALVGLVEEDRVVGEEAFSFAIRYPSTIYSGLRNLLGRSAGDAEVQRLLKDNMLLYKVTDHPLRGTAAIKVNETASYLVEELVVSASTAAAVVCAEEGWVQTVWARQAARAAFGTNRSCCRCSPGWGLLASSLTCVQAIPWLLGIQGSAVATTAWHSKAACSAWQQWWWLLSHLVLPGKPAAGNPAETASCCCCCFLQAGIFQYAKRITDEQAGESIVDTVITVPVWMGMVQRQAVMDAARVAGLNVLGLVNTHAAAALQYGIERDFSKKEQTVSMPNQSGPTAADSSGKFTGCNTMLWQPALMMFYLRLSGCLTLMQALLQACSPSALHRPSSCCAGFWPPQGTSTACMCMCVDRQQCAPAQHRGEEANNNNTP